MTGPDTPDPTPEQEGYETWDPPSSVSRLVEERSHEGRSVFDRQYPVWDLLVAHPGPMDTETAIGLMCDRLGFNGRRDVLTRFPDLDRFEGEVYFGFDWNAAQTRGTSLDIHGGKDGKQLFVLNCEHHPACGWFPVARNGQRLPNSDPPHRGNLRLVK